MNKENQVELIRKIDCRHRISIPTIIMKELRLEDGEAVKITYDMNGIHISKTHDQCLVCSGKSDYNIMGVKLCASCLAKIVAQLPVNVDIDTDSVKTDSIGTGGIHMLYGNKPHTVIMDDCAYIETQSCNSCSASGCNECDKISRFKR